MALVPEWSRRVEGWIKELQNHFYTKLGEVELAGFTTMEQLTAKEALTREFHPMPSGTPWGEKWEYAWFKGEVVLPHEAEGKKVVVRMATGGESALYINGINAGASDREHKEVMLTASGVPGERYQVLADSYAGHGPIYIFTGPTPEGRQEELQPGVTQNRVGESTFGIWEEEAYQLWLDVQTLFEIRNKIDPNSLRVAEIDKGLREFTLLVDFEVPYPLMMEGICQARKKLAPLLACENGSTAPTLYTFGHSHIDVAWLWPLAETERKCTRTFGTQLALMEEYPEYIFLQSQPHLYWMVKNQYPELYARIKEAVAQGRFIPEGGMWVEADTNISGGESLIRQFLYGKKFFREEFGVENELLWLPDVFGYSGSLPQIMLGCGIQYFSTQKIFWSYNGGEKFPYNTFIWEGIDGSEVLAHFCNDYNSHTNPATLIERWNERVQKDGITSRLVPFGYGDGGGGPTRDHLEYLRRTGNLEGVPKTRMTSPVEFFKDLEQEGKPENRYVGELYFQAHRGTYTSQARTKKGNRKSEFALREAEMWGAAAEALKGYKFPAEDLAEAWRKVLLNQFHDIIPGSSIARVYQEANEAYEEVIDRGEEVAAQAAASFTDNSGAVTVFNSLSWDRTVLIGIEEPFDGAARQDGTSLPVQTVDGEKLVQVDVPACGWTTLVPAKASSVRTEVHAEERALENEQLRVEFNDYGEIARILDKEAGRDLAAGPCNSFKMYKDVPMAWDAWDIDSTYQDNPVELPEKATFMVAASGPLVAAIRITRKLHHSLVTQEISIRSNSRRVDFDTVVDWQERHKLLKVNFPVSYYANEAIQEIQFGHIRRPNHKSRQYDADRFEVVNHKWTAIAEENRGFAVLNDCKYGVNVAGNSINLTLLKSALGPDIHADVGRQEFCYAFYAWNGSFADSKVVQESYNLNSPVMTLPGAAGEASLFRLDAPDVIIETVKPAEDGTGDMILRLYESKRTAVRCVLHTVVPFVAAYDTDMMENVKGPAAFDRTGIKLDFRPFEIKTLRLKLAK